MADVIEIYDQTRRELCDFLRSLPEEQLQTELPACPGWSIKDVVAHMTGVIADSAGGEIPEGFLNAWSDEEARARLNEWTDEQVRSRRSRSFDEICEEWEEATGKLTAMIKGESEIPDGAPPFPDRIVITDLAAHTQDIYGALNLDKDRESLPIKLGLSGYIVGLDIRLKTLGRPSLQIDAGERQWTVGDGEAQATIKGTRYELFRALSGRRSVDQIREMAWQGDPEPYVDLFFPYGIRTQAIEE